MTASPYTDTATARVVQALTDAGSKPRRRGTSEWIASCPCPAHGKGNGDRNPSLSVSEGRDGNAVLYCHAGCHTDDITAALSLTASDLFHDDGSRSQISSRENVHPLRTFQLPPRPAQVPEGECTLGACKSARRKGETCTARYTYTDAGGNAVGVVHRWDPKTFRPSTPDAAGEWKLSGQIPPVPYALPRVAETLRAGGTVLIVEGEKDADTVNAYDLPDLCATTNAHGSGKWKDEHTAALLQVAPDAPSGGRIVICGDLDEAGRSHTAKVAATFTDLGLTAPLVVYPTRGKDITEHLERGGNLDLGAHDGLRAPEEYARLGKVLTLEDLESLPPIRWGVEEWVSSPSAVLLVGAYALGKSALTLSMACSVASGTPFLGHATEERRVLYIVGEGARGLPRRVKAWEQTWGRDLPRDALAFMTRPSASLREEATWREIRRYCRAEGFGFVVLDTFSSLAPDADETKDAGLVIAGLNALAEDIDGTAILVHHPGWSVNAKDRARGGYQLEGNVDEVLTLDAVTEGSDHISAKIKKRKDGESGTVHYLRRIAVHLNGPDGSPLYDETGAPVTSVTVQHARLSDTSVPTRTRILQYLSACGDIGASPAEIGRQIGADHTTGSFRSVLRALESEGLARSDGSSRSRRYYADEEI